MDNPGPVISTELDDRLDRTTDPVAITIAQIRFDDDLKQERIAQHVQHQIDIRRCTNPSCPTAECNCCINEQFRSQFEPQPGDLGYNPKGIAPEISDNKSTKDNIPVEQGYPSIASPKPTSPIRVGDLELNALINTNFHMPIPLEANNRIGPEREHVEADLQCDRNRSSHLFERSFDAIEPSSTIGKRASSTRPPSPSRSPSKPVRATLPTTLPVS